MPKTLVLLPTYNEIKNLKDMASDIFKNLPETDLLIIDDNSPDGTGVLGDQLAQEKPNQVFVLHRKNKEGLGKAYIDGFDWALQKKYDFVFQMDADFSHDPKYLPYLLKTAQEADAAIGSRYTEGGGIQGWATHRRLLSFLGNLYVRAVLKAKTKDLTSGFRCFSRKTLDAFDFKAMKSKGNLFLVEMAYIASKKGFKVSEMPIVFVERRAGVPKMNMQTITEALISVWQLRQ